MKRVYYSYDKWEEIEYGMYKTEYADEKDSYIKKAIELLSNPQKLQYYMKLTTQEWKNSTERNMTTTSRNKQAWLGQASCCLYAKVPEDLTKIAWSMLTDQQRIDANACADIVINEWTENYGKNI